MDIYLFTANDAVRKCFKPISGSRLYTLHEHPPDELKARTAGAGEDVFVYLDIEGLTHPKQRAACRVLSERGVRYGIIDRTGSVDDIPLLFFNGASDYIGKTLARTGMTARRLRKTLGYSSGTPAERGAGTVRTADSGYIVSPEGWRSIRVGEEYTFCLMYIELDQPSGLRNKLSDVQFSTVMETFKKFVQTSVGPVGGKPWIWNDFGGLVLVPFDGGGFGVAVTCFRMILSRRIFCVEETRLDIPFSYRIALDIGNIVYKESGDTGTIVSDAINFIFHLGKKFVKPGNFCLTEEVFNMAPEGLRRSFRPCGSFEGKKIRRMRLPL